MLKGLPGRTVEVSVRLPGEGGSDRWIAGFSGVVENLADLVHAVSDHWTVYWKMDGARPHPGSITIWRDGFEGAEVKGSGRSLEEVVAEDDEETGATWEIVIRQVSVIIELLIYV